VALEDLYGFVVSLFCSISHDAKTSFSSFSSENPKHNYVLQFPELSTTPHFTLSRLSAVHEIRAVTIRLPDFRISAESDRLRRYKVANRNPVSNGNRTKKQRDTMAINSLSSTLQMLEVTIVLGSFLAWTYTGNGLAKQAFILSCEVCCIHFLVKFISHRRRWSRFVCFLLNWSHCSLVLHTR
jgi:hypothetical protein